MTVRNTRRFTIIGLVVLLASVWLAGGCHSDPQQTLILDVFDLVDRFYVFKVDRREMAGDALAGLLDRLKYEVRAEVRTKEIHDYLLARENGEDPTPPVRKEEDESPTPIPTPFDDIQIETSPVKITMNVGAAAFERELTSDKRDVAQVLLDGVEFIRQHIDTKKEPADLLQTALDAMLNKLDPHSGFLNLTDYSQLKQDTEGAFGGVGIEIGMSDGILTVIAPIEGTPAHLAGLLAKDRIVAIDGVESYGQTLNWAVKRIRGKVGEPVVLSVRRAGKKTPLDISVVRGKIKAVATKTRLLPGGIGHIRVIQFSARTQRDLLEAIRDFESQPEKVRCLILDFRNNPGGLLEQSVAVADLFLNSGLIVNTIGRGFMEDREHFAGRQGTRTNIPLVAMVNSGSASASEIVVGALKDHGRALVVGYQTFGKGSVQSIFELPNRTGLRLTTAMHYTPSGASIQAHGITPHVRFELPETETAFFSESKLAGHLKNITGDKAPDPDVSVAVDRLWYAYEKKGRVKRDAEPFSDESDLQLAFVRDLLDSPDLSVAALTERARELTANLPPAPKVD
ncbi:MAG: S41 family peptidase [Candidatus Lernaella stagnicola]|nr:S41 family peptidase [Candidatus Lernaella stagnicola]